MQSFGIPVTAEKLGFLKLRLCENLFLRVFHGEQKYRNRLTSLEQQRSLAFFKLRLCENLFLRVFHGEQKYHNRFTSLKQQTSLAFLSCDYVRIYFSGCFTGNKSTAIVWVLHREQK